MLTHCSQWLRRWTGLLSRLALRICLEYLVEAGTDPDNARRHESTSGPLAADEQPAAATSSNATRRRTATC